MDELKFLDGLTFYGKHLVITKTMHSEMKLNSTAHMVALMDVYDNSQMLVILAWNKCRHQDFNLTL